MRDGPGWKGLVQVRYILLVLIVALAAGLRLYHLEASSLWVDEIFTALFAAPGKSLLEVAQGPLNTPLPTPPLWFWITHAFARLLGPGDAIVRLPAVLAGCLGVLAIYLVARSLFSNKIGLISALLLAISPLHIYVSREARFYPAIVLFSLLTLYFLHRGSQERTNKWVWLGFVVATLLNLYTHLTALLVLAAELAYIAALLAVQWWRQARAEQKAPGQHPELSPGQWPNLAEIGPVLGTMFRRPVLRAWLKDSIFWPAAVSLALIATAFLPMFPYLLRGAAGERGFGNAGDLSGLTFSFDFMLGLLVDLGAGRGLSLSLYVAAAVLGVATSVRRYPRQMALLGCVSIVPFVLLFALRPKHWFAVKYAIFVLPLLIMAVALGIVALARFITALVYPNHRSGRSSSLGKLALLSLVVVFLALSLRVLDAAYHSRPGRWREIGQVFSSHVQPDQAIVTIPTEIQTMRTAEILAYYGPRAPDLIIIEAATLDELEAALDCYARIWVLVDRPDMERAGPLLGWLVGQAHVPLRLERAEKENPSSLLYLGQGQTREQLLREVGTLDYPSANLYGSLAEAFAADGLLADAKIHYQKAIALYQEQGGATADDVLFWHIQVQALSAGR